jgi:hypothetical protein
VRKNLLVSKRIVLNYLISAILFSKVAFQFLLCVSKNFLCSMFHFPPMCASVSAVCRDVGIFEITTFPLQSLTIFSNKLYMCLLIALLLACLHEL